MKTRAIILGLLLLSIVGIGVGYAFSNPVDFGFCTQNAISCRSNFHNIGNPLIPSAIALSIVFLILAFIPSAFSAWKKFALFAIPVALLLFIAAPASNSGGIGGGVGFGPTASETYQWVSGAYVVLSLLVISWTALRAKKNPKA